jgi:outer membrane lipoprotein-sorting protein
MHEAGRGLRGTLGAIGAILAVGLLFGAQSFAQEAAQPGKAPSNAVGGGSNWQTNVNSAPASNKNGLVLDENQTGLVKQIDGYFNAIGELEGKFLQTDAQSQQLRGQFFIKRPGRFRFVYDPPSRLVVLSDGTTLSFEDYDLKHADRYPLDSTPFKLLLVKNVNILRDAKVIELNAAEDLVTITVEDKSPDNPGQIQLFFDRSGDKIELKEWVITGPQGDNTRVEVASLVRNKAVDDSLFQQTNLDSQTTKTK